MDCYECLYSKVPQQRRLIKANEEVKKFLNKGAVIIWSMAQDNPEQILNKLLGPLIAVFAKASIAIFGSEEIAKALNPPVSTFK
jgi:hypothetical protein